MEMARYLATLVDYCSRLLTYCSASPPNPWELFSQPGGLQNSTGKAITYLPLALTTKVVNMARTTQPRPKDVLYDSERSTPRGSCKLNVVPKFHSEINRTLNLSHDKPICGYGLV
jgi:hypothetical protein